MKLTPQPRPHSRKQPLGTDTVLFPSWFVSTSQRVPLTAFFGRHRVPYCPRVGVAEMPRADPGGDEAMIPLDYLLSVALLTSAGDPSEAAGAFDHFRSVRPTVQAVAVYWEVLDNREVKYVMHRQEDFASDLKLLRRRWDDLADADAMRFPDRALISDLLSFNRSYRQQLEHRKSLELVYSWELSEVVAEVDRLYQIWDAARDARCEYYYISVRRGALKKLRDAVGDEAYYGGQLPPHVPVWRFARID